MNHLKYSLMLGLAVPVFALASAGCSSSDPATPGTGGTSSTGGSAGAGGTTGGAGGSTGGTGGASGGTGMPTSYAIIDDFELTTSTMMTVTTAPFIGGWFSYSEFTPTDPTKDPLLAFGPTDPHPSTSGMSTKALHVTGGPYLEYSGFGTDLNGPTTTFDAAALGYSGITFFAKKGSAAAGASIIVRVGSPETDPRGANGTTAICDPTAATGTTRCNDDFSSVPFMLTTEWKQFIVKFSTMTQGGWGNAPASKKLDPSKLWSVKFANALGAPIDTWIDDVAMYKE